MKGGVYRMLTLKKATIRGWYSLLQLLATYTFAIVLILSYLICISIFSHPSAVSGSSS